MKYNNQQKRKPSNEDNDNDSHSSNSDKEDYRELKETIRHPKKKNKNLGKLLKQIVRKSNKTNKAILSKLKEPFDKLKAEEIEKEELQLKKELRRKQKLLGYTPIAKWDKPKEKQLMKIATKGVVKLFNSICNYRKKVIEEKEEEEKKIEKKGTNFLMMHNLDPNFNSKIKKDFKEDLN